MVQFLILWWLMITSSSVAAETYLKRCGITTYCQCQIIPQNVFWLQLFYIREREFSLYLPNPGSFPWSDTTVEYRMPQCEYLIVSPYGIYLNTIFPNKRGDRYQKECVLGFFLRIFHGLFIYNGIHPVAIKCSSTCGIIFLPSIFYGKTAQNYNDKMQLILVALM